jgi:hypothetical protein
MVVKLKRALLIAGRFYQPGVIDIPEEKLKHPHFVRYIKCGVVVPPENEDVEKLENPVERAKRLHDQQKALEKKKKELLKIVDTPPEDVPPVDEPPMDDSKDEEAPKSPNEGKKKSKKG